MPEFAPVSEAIVVTSPSPGAGKTHVACALARWWVQRGYQPVPLHLSARGRDEVACPGGGRVSRPAALLAGACRLEPEPLFESGWEQLGELARRGDIVIVEAPWEDGRNRGLPLIEVERTASGLSLNGCELPWMEAALTPEPWPELEGLPEWTLATGPRTGVISLPHLRDFSDLALIRGAEWLTAAGTGQFDFLVAPATSNPAADAAWMEETGLQPWLEEQAARGALVVSCEWNIRGARRIERLDLTDYRRLSLLMGRRLAAPLPSEEIYDALAEWISAWAERASLAARLP